MISLKYLHISPMKALLFKPNPRNQMKLTQASWFALRISYYSHSNPYQTIWMNIISSTQAKTYPRRRDWNYSHSCLLLYSLSVWLTYHWNWVRWNRLKNQKSSIWRMSSKRSIKTYLLASTFHSLTVNNILLGNNLYLGSVRNYTVLHIPPNESRVF